MNIMERLEEMDIVNPYQNAKYRKQKEGFEKTKSKKSIPEVFAYLRAFATTSLKLAVRNASFASAPFFRSRYNLISPF